MNYFLKKKKWLAWVIMLTFLFTSILPSNIMAGNSVAEAAGEDVPTRELEILAKGEIPDGTSIALSGISTNNHFIVTDGWLTSEGDVYFRIHCDNMSGIKYLINFRIGGITFTGRVAESDFDANGNVIIGVGNMLESLITEGISVAAWASNNGNNHNSQGWDLAGMTVKLAGVTVLYFDIDDPEMTTPIHAPYTDIIGSNAYDVNGTDDVSEGYLANISPDYKFVYSTGDPWESNNWTDDEATVIAWYQKPIPVSGTKTWNDTGYDENRPANGITVKLLADGKEINRQTVTAESDWSWNFEGLDKYRFDEQTKRPVRIVYTIEEVPIPGYITTVNGYNIINTYTVSKAVTKVWNDDSNKLGL